MDFNNKVVLLTGASSGIGYELAKLLAKENARLVIASRRIELLNRLISEINAPAGRVIAIKCDISEKEEIVSLVKAAVEEFGTIDAAILNSGTSYRMSIEESTVSKWEEIMQVNTMSYLYFFDELLPVMKNNRGIIAGVSSLADTRGFAYSGMYSASKAAATRILESMRIELKALGIKVITVKPGFVRTPMTDKNKFYMPFMMGPEKAAEIILKGLKKEKRIIQFPFPTVVMSKLVKLVPNPVFEYFSRKVK